MKFSKCLRTSVKNLSSDCGHKFIDTLDLCTLDIQSLLWTCLDLKARKNSKQVLKSPLKGKKITFLCCSPNKCSGLIVQSAVKSLGADLQVMIANRWEGSKFKKDIGRFYSLYSDLIVVQGTYHKSICDLTDGASVPVVNISSHKFAPFHGLAVLMTLQEHFGRLHGLKVGWVGPMGNYLNTLIYLLPKVGIHLRYNSSAMPKSPATPLVLLKGVQICHTFNTTIEHCSDPLDTIEGVDLIGTSKHKYETLKIELEMFEKANSNWAFVHILPRWQGDVSEDVFNHKNSLVWLFHKNVEYSLMAVIISLLEKYDHITPKPNFGEQL